MERRDWSLKALKNLQYVDSLDSDLRAESLLRWVEEYIANNNIEDFDLTIADLELLSELFYKNMVFIKEHRQIMKQQIDNHKKIREFLK